MLLGLNSFSTDMFSANIKINLGIDLDIDIQYWNVLCKNDTTWSCIEPKTVEVKECEDGS